MEWVEPLYQIKSGEQAKEDYYEYAETFRRRAGVTQQLSLEKLRDIERAKGEEIGHIRARAGKSGLRVAGSVQTLSQKVSESYERQKLQTGTAAVEEMRGLMDTYAYYRKLGRRAKKAGYWGAGESILSTASEAGRMMAGFG